jgi:hypothetical protein
VLVTGNGKRKARFIAVLVAAVGLVGGCTAGGSSAASEPNPTAPSTIVTPSAAVPTPAASVAASPSTGPESTELTEDNRGETVAVKVGATVRVVLHSTYWSPATSSAPAIVAPTAAPTVSPAPPGTCLPGIGCGTVTSTFVASAPGDAVLTASRTVCGEALNCKPADRLWTVDLRVTR